MKNAPSVEAINEFKVTTSTIPGGVRQDPPVAWKVLRPSPGQTLFMEQRFDILRNDQDGRETPGRTI